LTRYEPTLDLAPTKSSVLIETGRDEPHIADAELGNGEDGEVDVGGLVTVPDGYREGLRITSPAMMSPMR
jgi:hypothetical protein